MSVSISLIETFYSSKVPWSKLGSEPVIVLLDRIFVLAEPPTDIEYSGDIKIQESKRQKIKVR